MKHEILLLTNIPSPYKIRLWKEISKYVDIKVIYTDKTESRRKWKIDFGKGYRYLLLRKIKFLKFEFSFQLFKEILNSRIIIIDGYGLQLMIQSIIFCKLTKKTYALWTDGAIVKHENIILKYIKKLLIRGANKYITTGIKGREHLIYYGAKSERVSIIPLSINVVYFHDQSLEYRKNKIKIKDKLRLEKYVILFVGRIVKEKGIFDLVNVFNRISNNRNDLSLMIIGNGKEEEKLNNNIKNNNKIKFIGFVDRDKLPFYYSISDIFVLPTYYDPWGAVINEAMACGLPVISTNMACASYELIKEGYNGFIINAGDIRQLQEKIKFLLNKRIIIEYGQNSYNRIKSNDHKIVAPKYAMIIKEMLKEIKGNSR